MLRLRYNPPVDVFPTDPWSFEATRFDAKLADRLACHSETLFALSNGYLGMRGMFEEGAPACEPGVFLNGFYEHRPISYGERAYGFPRLGQSILNCPDGTILRLFVDDEPLLLTQAEILSFRRTLDFKDGALRRDVRWVTASGKHMRLITTRLVSLRHRHLAAIAYQLTAEDADADVTISSEFLHRQPLPVDSTDPRLAEGFVGRVLHPTGTHGDGLRAILSYSTESSGLVLGCGMDHTIEGGRQFASEPTCQDDCAAVVFKAVIGRGTSIAIHKYLGYHYSDAADPEQIRSQTGWTLSRAIENGFAQILDQQRSDMSRFWSGADVKVEGGHPRIQQVIRWNLFQLLQASERVEGHGIGARGLTGRTYEGHYFWDTEIYVLPFLLYSQPRIARALLKHRYDMLDKARARAKELGFRGATFPWRTINGEEASAYYAAGTAQYHINADIAYALRKYVQVSGDQDFLRRCGAEILVETARFWCDLGFSLRARTDASASTA